VTHGTFVNAMGRAIVATFPCKTSQHNQRTRSQGQCAGKRAMQRGDDRIMPIAS
jgi:hypothetical protein